ncbi:hypothetical protein O3S80_23180 [Streptomyces sp. Lzd4kr]|nr:hypothetical protein [Streptomyces sp. Lzd4kr]
MLVGVVAADAALELEGVGDGLVDLATAGMAAVDDLQSVWMRCQRLVGLFGLCIECVSQFTELAGVTSAQSSTPITSST